MIIQFTNTAYLKMRYYTQECNGEISGLGKVKEVVYKVETSFKDEKETKKGLEIYDIEILKQEVSGGHSDIEKEDLAAFLFKKIRDGKDIKDYRVWWHSHDTMPAFFSVTDTDTIDASTEFPYLLSIVTNKSRDVEARLDIFKPVRVTELNIEIDFDKRQKNEAIKKRCVADIKRDVTYSRIGGFGFITRKRFGKTRYIDGTKHKEGKNKLGFDTRGKPFSEYPYFGRNLGLRNSPGFKKAININGKTKKKHNNKEINPNEVFIY